MRIDVVFDTVCPWCFIGKHRLERALALRPEVRAEIRWRPFLLNPEMPSDGLDWQLHLERKFGSAYRIQRIHGAIAAAGEVEGIAFDFGAISRIPNSVDSHRLIQWAADTGRQAALVEAIYGAYFVRGQDIGDPKVLRRLAIAAGLPGDEVERFLGSGQGISEVEGENARVHRLGVGGIPCYIFDGRYAVAGAQEPDMLARLIDIARGEAELEAESN
jgi:predicted DsbA family dithiol-disulfide isomerase